MSERDAEQGMERRDGHIVGRPEDERAITLDGLLGDGPRRPLPPPQLMGSPRRSVLLVGFSALVVAGLVALGALISHSGGFPGIHPDREMSGLSDGGVPRTGGPEPERPTQGPATGPGPALGRGAASVPGPALDPGPAAASGKALGTRASTPTVVGDGSGSALAGGSRRTAGDGRQAPATTSETHSGWVIAAVAAGVGGMVSGVGSAASALTLSGLTQTFDLGTLDARSTNSWHEASRRDHRGLRGDHPGLRVVPSGFAPGIRLPGRGGW